MSSWLYRWGRTAHTHHWIVVGVWLAVAAAIGGLLLVEHPRLSNEIRIDGTPAQQVLDDLAVRMPDAAGGQGQLAFHTDEGRIDEASRRAVLLAAVDAVLGSDHVVDSRRTMAAELAKGADSHLLQDAGALAQASAGPAAGDPTPLVVDGQQVPGVLVSADGRSALFQFAFDAQTFELPTGTVDRTIQAAQDAVAGQGIDVLPAATMIEIPNLIGVGEAAGVVFAAVVLVLALGSLVAAGLPLLSAFGGIAVGVGTAMALSHVVHMHSLNAVLALMLGVAVGMDYALFIVNRQRRFVLDQRLAAREATGRALGTAGSAVLFAGATVVIALLALVVVRIQLLTTMALTAAGTVVLAVASALTLLPALLGVVDERICSPRARERAAHHHAQGSSHRVARAWSGLLTRHRYVAALGALVVAGVLAVPAFSMTLGLPSGASYDTDTAQRQSFDVTSAGFGEGYNGPLVVVATSGDGAAVPPQDVAGLAGDLATVEGVRSVGLGGVSDDGSSVVLSVIPEAGPTDAATADVVTRLRQAAPELGSRWGVGLGVTGFAALAIDVSDRLSSVLPTYVGVVVGLSLIVLLLVFRSVVVPVKATLGFLLSVAATFGATTAVFQWGWLQRLFDMDATAPVLSLLPIVVTGVLYGLAMDYEVFFVSSMKEAHVHGSHGQDAVRRGFSVASRVVVAAAIIMTSVFAGFVLNPEPMIAQIGFALAFGILVDAFLVRMTFVPAVMAVFGDRAWWLPRWLDRRLPDLDIEGDALQRRLQQQAQEAQQAPQLQPVQQ